MSADIVDLAYTAIVDDQVDRLAVILYIQPVTDIFALSVYRKRLVIQRIGNHQRNELLREMIWSIVVGTSADRHRKSISPMISQH